MFTSRAHWTVYYENYHQSERPSTNRLPLHRMLEQEVASNLGRAGGLLTPQTRIGSRKRKNWVPKHSIKLCTR